MPDRKNLGADGKALYQADFYFPSDDSRLPYTVAVVAVLQDETGESSKFSFYRLGMIKAQRIFFSFTHKTSEPVIYKQAKVSQLGLKRPGRQRFQIIFNGQDDIVCAIDGKTYKTSPPKASVNMEKNSGPRVAVAQIEVEEGQFKRNCERGFHALEKTVNQGAEIIILPELWTSGYRLDKAPTYSRKNVEVLARISRFCRENKVICVAGSYILADDNKGLRNRCVVFDEKGGRIARYDKMHLFPGLGENHVFTKGEKPVTFPTPWGKAGLALCYDLRFPEIFRYYFHQKVKIILMPSQWPYPRINHWKTLISARAIENNCFIVACNVAGLPKKNRLFGFSRIVDPWGEVVAEVGHGAEVISAQLDLGKIREANDKLSLRCSVHPFFL